MAWYVAGTRQTVSERDTPIHLTWDSTAAWSGVGKMAVHRRASSWASRTNMRSAATQLQGKGTAGQHGGRHGAKGH